MCLYVGIWIFRHCKCPLGGHTPLVPLKVTTSAMSSYAFAYTSCISLFGPMSARIRLQVFPMYALTKSTHAPCIFLAMYCVLSCFLAVSEDVLYMGALYVCLCGSPMKTGCACINNPSVCMYWCVCMCIRACMLASVRAQCSGIVGAAGRRGQEQGY